MKVVIIIAVVVIIGLIVYYELRMKKLREKRILGQAGRKKIEERLEERKRKILEEIEKKGRITNNEVQQLLGISDSTATNYLDRLEEQGLIEQIGGSRKDTYYQLKCG